MEIDEVLCEVLLAITPNQTQTYTNLVWEFLELVPRVEVFGEVDNVREDGPTEVAFEVMRMWMRAFMSIMCALRLAGIDVDRASGVEV